MNLPDPCEKCAPFNGAWVETEAGLKRCDCERGKALKEARAAANQPARPPVLTEKQQATFSEMLAALKFYPSEAGARILIGSEIGAMCNSVEEAHWLVREMIRTHREWPGVLEMRALFCDRKDPRDGIYATSPLIEAVREAEQAREQLALPAPRTRQLPAGEPVSAAESINATVADLARKTSLVRVLANAPSPKVREIPVVRLTPDKLLTAADVERAAQEYRAKKAAEEIGNDASGAA